MTWCLQGWYGMRFHKVFTRLLFILLKARKREEGFVDKTSPEYFVRKLYSDADFRNMDPKVLVALYVSLKSQPIS